MLEFLKNLVGGGTSADFKELVDKGAQIIDVRSPAEYSSGHIKGSLNIPLDKLSTNLNKIKKDVPIITCCASGGRSSSAKGLLERNGYQEVYNGGSWRGLNEKLK